MPTYEVFLKETKETPKMKVEAATPDEAIMIYKAMWDNGKVPGDFIMTAFWSAIRFWRKQ